MPAGQGAPPPQPRVQMQIAENAWFQVQVLGLSWALGDLTQVWLEASFTVDTHSPPLFAQIEPHDPKVVLIANSHVVGVSVQRL